MDLDSWDVALRTGEVLRVKAHGYAQDGGDYVFEALVEGRPRKRIEVLRIPESLVGSIRGG